MYGICPGCGLETRLNHGYCEVTVNCSHTHQSRIARGIGRAIDSGCFYVWFDPILIFQLSEWHCYICRQATPRSLLGTRDAASPQLDHVTPLCRGGPHTPENVECICARCNRTKNDRTLEKMGLSVSRLPRGAVAAIPRTDHPPGYNPVRKAMLESSLAAVAGHRAAEDAMEEHRRNGWRPPEREVTRQRRPRIIE
jgi:hypothetical protein